MPTLPVARPIADVLLDWYAGAARDLPWRRPDAGPWAVLVSEVMLQQTPVPRVLPVYADWLARWPAPAELAAAPAGAAVRHWGRLGYPRRALRLHESAREISHRHGGAVPDQLDALLRLPGVGAYTARAVASFAFGQRHPVLDTNARRVLARVVSGAAGPGPPAAGRDLALAEPLLPPEPARAAGYAAALMEFGALVCTAGAPRCHGCPLRTRCSWRLAGQPTAPRRARRGAGYAGTDRQARGRLLAVLRAAVAPVEPATLAAEWDEPLQRARALDSLLVDGLMTVDDDGRFALPG